MQRFYRSANPIDGALNFDAVSTVGIVYLIDTNDPKAIDAFEKGKIPAEQIPDFLELILGLSSRDTTRYTFLIRLFKRKLIDLSLFQKQMNASIQAVRIQPEFYNTLLDFYSESYDDIPRQIDNLIRANLQLSPEIIEVLISDKIGSGLLSAEGLTFEKITQFAINATYDQLVNFWLLRLCPDTYLGSITQMRSTLFGGPKICDYAYIAEKVETELPKLKGKVSYATKCALQRNGVVERLTREKVAPKLRQYLQDLLSNLLKDNLVDIAQQVSQEQDQFQIACKLIQPLLANIKNTDCHTIIKTIFNLAPPVMVKACFYICLKKMKAGELSSHDFKLFCLLPFEDSKGKWPATDRDSAIALLAIAYEQLNDLSEAKALIEIVTDYPCEISDDISATRKKLKATLAINDDAIQLSKIVERFYYVATSDNQIGRFREDNIRSFTATDPNNRVANLAALFAMSPVKRDALYLGLQLCNSRIISPKDFKNLVMTSKILAQAAEMDGAQYANTLALYIVCMVRVGDIEQANKLFKENFIFILKNKTALDAEVEQVFYEYVLNDTDKLLIPNADYKWLLLDARFYDINLKINLLLQAILKGSYLDKLLVSNSLANAHASIGLMYVSTEKRIQNTLKEMISRSLIKLTEQTVELLMSEDHLKELFKSDRLRAGLTAALNDFIVFSTHRLLAQQVKIKLFELTEGKDSINCKHELCRQALKQYKEGKFDEAEMLCNALLRSKLDIPDDIHNEFYYMLISGRFNPVEGYRIANEVLEHNFINYPRNPEIRKNLVLQAICGETTFVGSLTTPRKGWFKELNAQYTVFAAEACKSTFVMGAGINEVTKQALKKEVLGEKEFSEHYIELYAKTQALFVDNNTKVIDDMRYSL